MQKNRSILNSPRLRELKRKKHRILRTRAFVFVLFGLVIFVGLGFLSRWEKINIKNIEISGNKVVETKMIEKLVQENIFGYYLGLFPKSNFIFYPRGIKEKLSSRFHRLKDISVGMSNSKTLVIKVTERDALYTWCGVDFLSVVTEQEKNKCYFMDESGYIFDEAPYFSGEVYFKFFGRPTSESTLGAYFSEQNFKKLVLFKEMTEKIGLKPASLLVKNDGDIELFLSSHTGSAEAPKIIFKSRDDFDKVMENLQTSIATEPLKSELDNKYSSLLYIDLRFGNKVYYKFK